MRRLAEDYQGRAVFRSIEVEKEPDLARAYRYQSLPLTVIMTPSGKVVYRHEGYVDEEVLLEKLKAAGME
jgi:thioredoxin-like negative regulator of GroEL